MYVRGNTNSTNAISEYLVFDSIIIGVFAKYTWHITES